MPKHDRSAFGIGALSLGGVVGALAGAHKITEALIHLRKLYDVGGDNMIFVRIIDRVRIDLAEVERLLALKDVKFALSRSPEKTAWIRKSIAAVKLALQEMAQHTMRVRKDTDRGKWVGLRNRIYWRLEEYDKLVMHCQEVARCHEGLLSVLAFLAALEPLACCDQDQKQYSSQQYDVSQQYDGAQQYDNYVQYDRNDYQDYQQPRQAHIDVDITRRADSDRPAHTHGRFEEDFVEIDRKIEIERRPRHHDGERYVDVERRAEVERHGPGHRAHAEARFVERDGQRSIEIDRRSNSSRGGRDERHYSIRESRDRDDWDLTGRLADKLQDKLVGGLSKL